MRRAGIRPGMALCLLLCIVGHATSAAELLSTEENTSTPIPATLISEEEVPFIEPASILEDESEQPSTLTTEMAPIPSATAPDRSASATDTPQPATPEFITPTTDLPTDSPSSPATDSVGTRPPVQATTPATIMTPEITSTTAITSHPVPMPGNTPSSDQDTIPSLGTLTITPQCNGKFLPAWLHLTRIGDAALPTSRTPILLEKEARLQLTPGQYILRVDGDARIWGWKQPVVLTTDNTDLTATLTPFWPPKHMRTWIAADLFATKTPSPTACLASGIRIIASPTIPDTLSPDAHQIWLARTTAEASGWGRVTLLHHNDTEGLSFTSAHIPMENRLMATKNGVRIWEAPSTQNGAGLILATIAGPMYDLLAIHNEDDMAIWYFLLEQGYRIPAVLFPERMDARPSLTGYLPQGEYPYRAASALPAIRQGLLTPSNGPLITMQANGLSGNIIIPANAHMSHQLIIDAISSTREDDRIDRVELLLNGTVLRSYPGRGEQRIMHVELELDLPHPGWLMARYISHNKEMLAFTNPIYITTVALRSPPVPVTRVTLRAQAAGKGIPCTVEVWNGTLFLGQYAIPENGSQLELPCTAHLTARRQTQPAVATVSLLQATGAMTWLKEHAELSSANALLRDPAAYAALRSILEEANITFTFKE